MRSFPPDAMSRTDARERRHDGSDFYASNDHAPAPSGMFTRLGVLLVIALGFGLTAQLLVGMPH